MDLPDIDLGALLAFDAIRRTGSVTLASIELDQAQSTLSNRLRRLREQLGDPLFVRTPHGMAPTPYADKISENISGAIALLNRGLNGAGGFDPRREERNFTIVMTDLTEILLLPALLQRCRADAPGMGFTTFSLTDRETEQALQTGAADVAIGFFPSISPSLVQRHIMESGYVCIAAKHHPTIGDRISKRAFLSARYALAHTTRTGHHVIEQALQRAGVAHQISARVSGFLALPMIVASTDMIATVPRPLAEMMRNAADIKIRPHPLDLPKLVIGQFWHRRFHNDPGNVWLRRMLGELYKSIAVIPSR